MALPSSPAGTGAAEVSEVTTGGGGGRGVGASAVFEALAATLRGALPLPELMLRYRAAILLIRTHIPQVINGMHTVEELKDVEVSKTIKEARTTTKQEPALKNAINGYLNTEEVREQETAELQEVEELVSQGYKEVTLLGQNIEYGDIV